MATEENSQLPDLTLNLRRVADRSLFLEAVRQPEGRCVAANDASLN